MSSAIGSVKQAYVSLTADTDKAADLAKDTIDLGNPGRHPAGITTDHGVYVSDTDNWYAQRGSIDGLGSQLDYELG